MVHADPYLVEPLRACEANGDIHAHPLREGIVMPSPVPGYDLAAFMLLAQLPYAFAVIVWGIALWSAVLLTVLALRRLTGMPLNVLIAALILSDGYASSLTGNLLPLALGGLAFAAWCASRRRYPLSALGLLVAMCEPHIGLSALAACFFCIPLARGPIFLAVCALGVLTYAATGVAETIEYLRDVLPRHIASEIANNATQYSLTNLLHIMGVSDRAAILAGDLSYAAMFVVGIFVAQRLSVALREEAFLVLIPPAFTLIGGPFIHLVQMAAALPAGFLLYARVPSLQRSLRWVIMLLAVPWTLFVQLSLVLPIVAICVALLARTFVPNRPFAAAFVMIQLAVIFVAATLTMRFHTTLPAPTYGGFPATAFAEDVWRLIVQTKDSPNVAFFLPLKIPTWCGLVLLAWEAIRTAFDPREGGRQSAG